MQSETKSRPRTKIIQREHIYSKPNEQLFTKRWPLSYLNTTKYHIDTKKLSEFTIFLVLSVLFSCSLRIDCPVLDSLLILHLSALKLGPLNRFKKSNGKAMNRNCGNQKANPAYKTTT